MARHTSFRFLLDPSVEQERVLSRHVGAARFAFNLALQLHRDARSETGREQGRVSASMVSDGDGAGPGVEDSRGGPRVPWSGFDLINAFNAWKVSEAAGRRFVVDPDRTTDLEVTGLVWRGQVLAQVFEEAAVDAGRALKACIDSRTGARKGPPVGFPRFKKKNPAGGSFRIRNKTTRGRSSVRVGDDGSRQGRDGARSVSLPKIGALRVREDTRRLRRMIAMGRARILHVTVTRGANRWWISITVQAADLHHALRHTPRSAEASPQVTQEDDPHGVEGWVGVDRGLHALAVAGTSNGVEVLRVANQRATARSAAAASPVPGRLAQEEGIEEP